MGYIDWASRVQQYLKKLIFTLNLFSPTVLDILNVIGVGHGLAGTCQYFQVLESWDKGLDRGTYIVVVVIKKKNRDTHL